MLNVETVPEYFLIIVSNLVSSEACYSFTLISIEWHSVKLVPLHSEIIDTKT